MIYSYARVAQFFTVAIVVCMVCRCVHWQLPCAWWRGRKV